MRVLGPCEITFLLLKNDDEGKNLRTRTVNKHKMGRMFSSILNINKSLRDVLNT